MSSGTATPSDASVLAGCHCSSLRQAARRATALYDAAMAPFGLRISQFGLLARLHRIGPSSVQALAAALVLDRTTMARNLRALERDGLLVSEDDPADRRVRRLRITEAGVALLDRARPAWQAAQVSFKAQFGPAATETLQGELHRLVRTVRVPEEG